MSAIEHDVVVEMVDALNTLYGAHPHSRAAHAKGSYYRATFTPTAEAARLSRAPHLQGDPVPALVRFSNGSGDPQAHDGAADGRGMAVKFSPGTEQQTDIVALSLPVFFVRDVDGFLAFTRARTPDPSTGAPDPQAFGTFLAAHPEAMPAISAAISAKPPASYAQCTYNGIHSFHLVAADGTRRAVRYRWTPQDGEATVDPAEAQQRDRDYLRAEMRERLAHGPARMLLTAILAAPGDPVDDAAAQWPEDRERIALGELAITATAEDPEAGGSVVVFDPTNVVDGIECSDDPILHARRAAYSESVNRRTR